MKSSKKRCSQTGCEAAGDLEARVKIRHGREEPPRRPAWRSARTATRVDIDGDYTETLARIDANKTGIGVFGLVVLREQCRQAEGCDDERHRADRRDDRKGEYPVSRPLFFYVKKAHLGVIPGLKEYVEFFISDQMIGPDGPLAKYGLVAAPDAEREAIRKNFEDGNIL